MASSDHRSISGSHSIPFSRDSSDAFQDMTAFTPPPESWLINRSKSSSTKKDQDPSKKNQLNNNSSSSSSKVFKVPKGNQLDDPCKQYIETSDIPVKSSKCLGTDDHFKSAVCSKNLLKVCEKLMTKKDFLVSSSNSDGSVDDDFDAELSLMNEKSRMEYYRNKHGNRRDSQSLPASPKMDRKSQAPVVKHNPYFTVSKQPETRNDTSISFLTSLFGITAKNPKEAQANLAQKYEATSHVSNSGGDNQQQQQQQPSSRQMTPQPHIYREMNIFSPTSM